MFGQLHIKQNSVNSNNSPAITFLLDHWFSFNPQTLHLFLPPRFSTDQPIIDSLPLPFSFLHPLGVLLSPSCFSTISKKSSSQLKWTISIFAVFHLFHSCSNLQTHFSLLLLFVLVFNSFLAPYLFSHFFLLPMD